MLTDIEMPNMDGFALTEAIRAHPTLANIPVLILSSRSSAADRQRGLDAGADGYIQKSGFDEASLLSAVNRLLGNERMSSAISGPKIRVLLVDEESSQRSRLVEVLRGEGDIVVVDQRDNAAEAIEQVAQSGPDVVILDLHLRGGQSQHTIEQIMARTPTPILVLSARTDDRHSPSAVQALVAGALEALPRPHRWTPELGAELRRTVRLISTVHVIRHPRGGRPESSPPESTPRAGCRPVVAIAASTGGPSALATVLSGLAELQAPVLVVQHLHADFVAGLVQWMSRVSALPVEIASAHQIARPGTDLPRARWNSSPARRQPQTRVRPSSRSRCIALRPMSCSRRWPTALGRRGSASCSPGWATTAPRGCWRSVAQGGVTLAQDEASSAVFGMPQAAERLGAVTEMLPLDKLATAIQRAVRQVQT